MFSFFITWFDVYISNVKPLHVFWWLQHLFSFSVIQTTESLHRYPGALGGDHRGLLADAVGAQFHHRCDAHQAAWDGQSECLLIRHSDHKRNEDFILKTRVPASFLWNTRVLRTCSGPFITVLNFNLQSHIKFFHLYVLKKELVLLFQWNTIIETNTSDLFWLSMCSYFLSLWTS